MAQEAQHRGPDPATMLPTPIFTRVKTELALIWVVIWTRQSNEESRNAETTHGRRLISTTYNPPPLPHDISMSYNVVNGIKEYVSSLKHSIKDRKAFGKISKNPSMCSLADRLDRLPRRAEKVSKILAMDHVKDWLTRGVKTASADVTDWIDVKVNHAAVKAQIAADRVRERQIGFYGRSRQITSRLVAGGEV